jgi:uncharacterized protein YndB with AHSA1/START domain/predicted enzyme related to lactoylglutathione lyase
VSDTQTAAPVLEISRTFDAPRERVFAAFTTPALIRAWFGPVDSRIGAVTFDARLGGTYRIEMSPTNGEAYNVSGTITEYDPPSRIAYTFRWEEDDPADEIDTLVRIEFVERGAQTEMRFHQEQFRSVESRDRHGEGWGESFDKLAASVGPIRLRGIDLSGYMVTDTKRAMAWYRDLFGLEPSIVYPDDRGAEYDLPDGSTFGLWGGGGNVMPFQPSNGVMFAVDDIEASVARLTSRGVPVGYRTETPVCHIAMLHDSEGNTVTLHQRKMH